MALDAIGLAYPPSFEGRLERPRHGALLLLKLRYLRLDLFVGHLWFLLMAVAWLSVAVPAKPVKGRLSLRPPAPVGHFEFEPRYLAVLGDHERAEEHAYSATQPADDRYERDD